MREIPLSQGYKALVDDEDYDRVMAAGSWSVCVKPNNLYALRGVRKAGGGWTTIRLHNFVTGWRFVDHINENGLDNRKTNLREATHATNGRNVGPRATNTSGFKGVTWSKRSRKWAARIQVDGRSIYLGVHVDIKDAARAYDAAAIEHFGEFARLNFNETEIAS